MEHKILYQIVRVSETFCDLALRHDLRDFLLINMPRLVRSPLHLLAFLNGSSVRLLRRQIKRSKKFGSIPTTF